jgi:hypothetical protein
LAALVFDVAVVVDLAEVRDLADFCLVPVRAAASDSTGKPGPEIQKIDVRVTRRNSNERWRLEIMRAPVSSLAGNLAISRVSAL